MGTPKTLKQAIENAIIDWEFNGGSLAPKIEAHVVDFLAQKFSIAMLRFKGLDQLWYDVTGRIVGQDHREQSVKEEL